MMRRRLVLLEHRDDAVRLEDRRLYVVQVLEALAARDRAKLREGDRVSLQVLLDVLAVADQVDGVPGEQAREGGPAEGSAVQALVQPEERDRADDGAGHRDVVPDDPV